MKTMALVFLLLLASGHLAGQGKRKREAYDPDKLGPMEIACGRVGAKNSAPCKCMNERTRIRSKAIEKCEFMEVGKARNECYAAVDHCPAVSDRDSAEGMAAHCKRWCSKARCECCHT